MTNQRHDRQSRLPGWNQERVTQASVIIVGMGALGNAVAQALALAGVGRMMLCDGDTIELSNLSRTPLFVEADIGRSKVEAAARALIKLAPDIQIETRALPLETGIGLGELKAADLVLGCLDSRSARLELAGRCALVGVPWIDGATGQWSGGVRPWLDPNGPCFGCGMDDASRAENDGQSSCRLPAEPHTAAATAPLSLLVGAHMALLALRFLMGLVVDGAIKVIDGASGLVSSVWQARDLGCPFHHPLPKALEIDLSHRATVGQLLALLGPGAVPLAWQPFQNHAHCRQCGYVDAHSTRTMQTNCAECGGILHKQTHLEIDRAAPDTPLLALGIPPSEILAVREGAEIRYIQLTN